MKSTRTWWFAFCGCAAFVAVAMLGISVLVMRMERHALALSAEADRSAEMRTALWDMESWLIAHLGREASRPYDEYQSYFPADNVYTRYFSKIAPGDVYAPSPLLTFDSDYFPIHFQIDPSNVLTSPQVPRGNELDLAQATLLPEGWIDRKSEALAHVDSILSYNDALLYCTDYSLSHVATRANLGGGVGQTLQSPQTFYVDPEVPLQWQDQVGQSDSEIVQQTRDAQSFNRRE